MVWSSCAPQKGRHFWICHILAACSSLFITDAFLFFPEFVCIYLKLFVCMYTYVYDTYLYVYFKDLDFHFIVPSTEFCRVPCVQSIFIIQLIESMRCISFRIFFYFLIFIYLAVPGLSCSMWDLVPWPGMEPGSPPLEA